MDDLNPFANSENSDFDAKICYQRLTDSLASHERFELIAKINTGDWLVLNELCKILPGYYTPPGDDTDKDIEELAYFDIYSLARNTFDIVPRSKDDVQRVINKVIRTLNTTASSKLDNFDDIVKGLVEIAKASKTGDVFTVNWEAIDKVDWTETPCSYPVKWCFDYTYQDVSRFLESLKEKFESLSEPDSDTDESESEDDE